MKIGIDRKSLALAVRPLVKIAGGRTTLPILSNVRIGMGGTGINAGLLTMQVSDLDMWLAAELPCNTGRDGDILLTTVPVKQLSAIIKGLKQETVELDYLPSVTEKIEGEKDKTTPAKFTVNGSMSLPMFMADEFPPLPKMEATPFCTLHQGQLKGLLTNVKEFQSMDESRYVLNGTLFERVAEVLNLVATNGRTLTISSLPMEMQEGKPVKHIVPSKAVNLILSMLEQSCEAVDVSYGRCENKTPNPKWKPDGQATEGTLSEPEFLSSILSQYFTFTFTVKGVAYRLVTKLIEGNYPAYRQVLPAEHRATFSFDRKELVEAVKQVALATTDANNSVKFTFAEGYLTMTAGKEHGAKGTAKAILITDGGCGVGAFNPAYILDALNATDTQRITICHTDELTPISIKSSELPGWVSVIMPMRLS